MLTPYNKSCIDKWLSTRPVLDAGLLSGIGAERSVEWAVRHGRNNEHEAPVETEIGKALRLCPSLVSTGAFLFREKDFEHGGGWLWLRQSSKRKGRSPLI